MADFALFCEDRGHELYVRALVGRLTREAEVDVRLRTISASRGKGQAITQLRGWQRSFERGLVGKPDLVIVVIDGNCTSSQAKKREIAQVLRAEVFPHWVIGSPDPHVERWCFADALAFERIVGRKPPADPAKCERALYKRLLREALDAADQPVLTDEMEIAPDLVEAADLEIAARAQPSLGSFVSDLRDALKIVARH
jgi:hypothetical protein